MECGIMNGCCGCRCCKEVGETLSLSLSLPLPLPLVTEKVSQCSSAYSSHSVGALKSPPICFDFPFFFVLVADAERDDRPPRGSKRLNRLNLVSSLFLLLLLYKFLFKCQRPTHGPTFSTGRPLRHKLLGSSNAAAFGNWETQNMKGQEGGYKRTAPKLLTADAAAGSCRYFQFLDAIDERLWHVKRVPFLCQDARLTTNWTACCMKSSARRPKPVTG